MDASANLSLPATTKMLYVFVVLNSSLLGGEPELTSVCVDLCRTLVNCKLMYIPDEVRALAGLEQLCVLPFVHITILMYQQAVLLTSY